MTDFSALEAKGLKKKDKWEQEDLLTSCLTFGNQSPMASFLLSVKQDA
jgi:hypothetical protein